MQKKRCKWVTEDKLYQDYHDNEWGRPVTDNIELFAKLCLDGQQAGLSWITVLKKQKNYEKAFCNFNPEQIAKFDSEKIEQLLQDKGIIRNRQKINSIIKNAKAYLALKEQGIEFSEYLWQFVDHKTIINAWREDQDIPATSPESDQMAKSLKKLGFSFVGSTICYAFMQAVGMVNDHVVDCHCYEEVCRLART